MALRSYGGGGRTRSTTKFTIRNNCGGLLLLRSVFLLLVLRAVIMMSAASEPVPRAPAMNFEPRIETAGTEVNLQTHRRSRAGFKSHMTRLYHELEALMFNPANLSHIQQKVEKLDAAYLKYMTSSQHYIDTNCKDKDKRAAEQALASDKKNKAEFDIRVREWVESVQGFDKADTQSNHESVESQSVESHHAVSSTRTSSVYSRRRLMEAKANQAKAVLNISNLVKIYELECEKRLLDQRLALVQAQALADEAELEVGLWQGELDRKALNTSDKQVHIPHSDYGEQYTLRNNVTSHQEVDWLTHGSADPGDLLEHVSAGVHDIPRNSVHMLAGTADLTLLRHVSADPDSLLKYASASADEVDRHKGQVPCRYVATGTGDNHGQSGHKGHIVDLPGYKGRAGEMPGSADPGGSHVSAGIHDIPRDSIHMLAGKADLTLLRHVSADPDSLLKYASASADDLDRHKGQDPCRYVAAGTGDNHGQSGHKGHVDNLPGYKGHAGDLPGYKGHAGDLPGYKGHAGDLPGSADPGGSLERVSAMAVFMMTPGTVSTCWQVKQI